MYSLMSTHILRLNQTLNLKCDACLVKPNSTGINFTERHPKSNR